MSKKFKSVKNIPLILCILLLLSAVPVSAAAGGATAFRYVHDPRLNSKAMEDIVVDPSAVYGFSPSPDGILKQYISFDWTDPELVNGKDGRLARIAYHESIQEMYVMLDEMTAAGKSVEEIARAVSTKRNEIRLASYAGNPEGLAAAKARNLERYGHEEGPLPDEQYEQYGSWETVIEKSFGASPGMDALLGLYDDYYDLYVASGYIEEESKAAASRAYAVAAFADAAGTADTDPGSAAIAKFSDADGISPWFAAELEAAADAGVVNGYEDGTLRPQETVRRIEALVILSRCLGALDAVREPVAFSDVPAWAKDDIDRLSAAGLVDGYGGGTLGAYDSLTVEQVSVLTARVRDGGL